MGEYKKGFVLSKKLIKILKVAEFYIEKNEPSKYGFDKGSELSFYFDLIFGSGQLK